MKKLNYELRMTLLKCWRRCQIYIWCGIWLHFRCAGVGRDVQGGDKSDDYEGVDLLVEYEFDSDHDNSFGKGVKDEVNVKIDVCVD